MTVLNSEAVGKAARKGMAVVLAALLCMPATGIESIAYGAPSSAAARESGQADALRDAPAEQDAADVSAASDRDEGAARGGQEADSQQGASEQAPSAESDAASDAASSMDQTPLANAPKEDIGTPADVQLQVRNAPTTGGASNAYLIRAGEAPPIVSTPIELKIKENESIGSWNDRVTLTLHAPYLYYGSDGEVYQTTKKSEWQQNQGDTHGMRIALMPNAGLDGHWELYTVGEDGSETKIEKDSKEWSEGVSGVVRLKYVNNGGVMAGSIKPQIPEFSVRFKGSVPENTMAKIDVGMHVGVYTDSSGAQHKGDFTIDPGKNENGKVRSAMFVNSNLEWESSTKCISSNALWDRINYMVYEVRMRNTSKSTKSEIYRASFDVYSEIKQSNGMRQEDLAAYKVDESGNVVENPDPHDTSATLVGKPGEGGALVYDVTALSDEQRAAIDLVSFSNVDDLGLDELSYRSLQSGHVNIDLPHDGNGHLVSKGDSDNSNPDDPYAPGNYDETVLYVALPYTTNFVPHDQGDGTSIFENVVVENTPTVYFSTNGAISWSKKADRVSKAFTVPQVGFSLQKNALDFSSTPQKRTDGALGYLSHYAISDISASGNVPVFGPDSLTADYGAVVSDTLPSDFDLASIDIFLDKQTIRGLPENSPEDWFAASADGSRSYVQFETKGSDGASSWVSLGDPQYVGETADGAMHWKLGADEAGGFLYENEALENGFTGAVRFLMKDALAPGTEMPGTIGINGVMTLPHDEYRNDARATYSLKEWVPSVGANPGRYNLTDHEAASQATLVPRAVRPELAATAFEGQDGAFSQQGSSIVVALGAKAGYRFVLSNESVSAMMPARFELSGLSFKQAESGAYFGFVTEGLLLSKGLLDHARGITLQAGSVEGGLHELSDDELRAYVRDDGSAFVPADALGGGYVQSLSIDMEAFDGAVARPDAFVQLAGAMNCMGTFEAEGIFKTNYGEAFEEKQQESRASAVLQTKMPVPTLASRAFKRFADGSQEEGASIVAPLGAQSGYRFDAGNASPSVIAPASFTVDGLTFKRDEQGGYLGFETDRVVLSADFLKRSSDVSVKVRTAEGGTYGFDVPDSDGSGEEADFSIERSRFAGGHLQSLEVAIGSFDGSVPSAGETAYIELVGTTTCMGSFAAHGAFATDYDPNVSEQQAHAESSSTIAVEHPVPKMNALAWATAADGSVESGSSVSATYGRQYSGYRLELGNYATSPMAPARLSASGLHFVARPSDGSKVGFDAQELKFSKAFLAAAQRPSLTIHALEGDVAVSADDFAALPADSRGDVVVRVADVAANRHVTGFDVDMESFGSVAAEGLGSSFVEIKGVPFGIDTFSLDARFSTAYPDSLGLPQVGVSASASIEVNEPRPELHIDGSYVETPASAQSSSSNTDGTQMQISVPYDRDFELWASVGNAGDVALDDVDMAFSLPLSRENVSQADGTTASAVTGFHATKVVLTAGFLEAFAERGAIELYDYRDSSAPVLTLSPAPGDAGFIGAGVLYEPDPVTGDIAITEQNLADAGITDLAKVELPSWKKVAAHTSASGRDIVFEGFSDQAFDTTRTLDATMTNHFDGA